MSDLSDLIDHYEAEKASLERFIQKRIDQGEFDLAHFHNKALRVVQQQLQRLRLIQDPHYLDKLKRKALEERPMPEWKRALYKNRYPAIDSQTHTFQEDGQIIDDLLYKLIGGQITNFTIINTPRAPLYLNFSYFNKCISVELYRLASDRGYLTFWERHRIKELREIGFVQEEHAHHLRKTIIQPPRDILDLKERLAALFYEVFDCTRDEEMRNLKIIVEDRST